MILIIEVVKTFYNQNYKHLNAFHGILIPAGHFVNKCRQHFYHAIKGVKNILLIFDCRLAALM